MPGLQDEIDSHTQDPEFPRYVIQLVGVSGSAVVPANVRLKVRAAGSITIQSAGPNCELYFEDCQNITVVSADDCDITIKRVPSVSVGSGLVYNCRVDIAEVSNLHLLDIKRSSGITTTTTNHGLIRLDDHTHYRLFDIPKTLPLEIINNSFCRCEEVWITGVTVVATNSELEFYNGGTDVLTVTAFSKARLVKSQSRDTTIIDSTFDGWVWKAPTYTHQRGGLSFHDVEVPLLTTDTIHAEVNVFTGTDWVDVKSQLRFNEVVLMELNTTDTNSILTNSPINTWRFVNGRHRVENLTALVTEGTDATVYAQDSTLGVTTYTGGTIKHVRTVCLNMTATELIGRNQFDRGSCLAVLITGAPGTAYLQLTEAVWGATVIEDFTLTREEQMTYISLTTRNIDRYDLVEMQVGPVLIDNTGTLIMTTVNAAAVTIMNSGQVLLSDSCSFGNLVGTNVSQIISNGLECNAVLTNVGQGIIKNLGGSLITTNCGNIITDSISGGITALGTFVVDRKSTGYSDTFWVGSDSNCWASDVYVNQFGDDLFIFAKNNVNITAGVDVNITAGNNINMIAANSIFETAGVSIVLTAPLIILNGAVAIDITAPIITLTGVVVINGIIQVGV